MERSFHRKVDRDNYRRDPVRIRRAVAACGDFARSTIDPLQASKQAPNTQPHDQPEVLPSGIKFTHLTDPLEHAFTLDVPEGWRSEAGLARFSIIQINPYVRTLSPDKMTYLLLGEPNMPTYAPPSEMGLRLGYREGTLYSPGLGQRVLIMHYLPGTEFAKTYGQIALGSLCPALKFVSVEERPDLARKADSALPTVIPSRATGGEAWFTCTHNKQDMDAKIEAVTRITRDNIGWAVIWLGALITPKGQMDRSHAILTHVVGSMVWDPKWIQMQNSLSQQAAQITAQQIAESERKEAAFIGKLNSVDENFAAVDEIITGNSHYHDSQSGQDYYLNNLNPFKWIDDNGRIVGTESNTKPPFGYDYRSLTHVSSNSTKRGAEQFSMAKCSQSLAEQEGRGYQLQGRGPLSYDRRPGKLPAHSGTVLKKNPEY